VCKCVPALLLLYTVALLPHRAAQIPTPPQAAAAGAGEQSKPVLSLEQVRAHLERHNVLHGRPQHKDKQQPHSSGDAPPPPAAAAAAGGDDEAAGDAMELDGDDEDLALAEELDDFDDLVVEPAPQQQGKAAAAAAAGMELLPETQQVLLDELPTLQQRLAAAAAAGAPVVGTELPADLDLQLGEDDEGDAHAAAVADGSSDKQQQQQQQQQQADRQAVASGAARQLVDAEAAESDGDGGEEASGADEADGGDSEQEGSGSEGEEEGTEGSQDGSDEEDDDPLADLSLSEEEEEPSRQQQEPEVEPEPLNWEEEEEELAGAGDSPQKQQQQQPKKLGRVNAAKLVAKLRHKAAACGFIEAEAELSDDDEGGGSEDEDDDEDQDGMLVSLQGIWGMRVIQQLVETAIRPAELVSASMRAVVASNTCHSQVGSTPPAKQPVRVLTACRKVVLFVHSTTISVHEGCGSAARDAMLLTPYHCDTCRRSCWRTQPRAALMRPGEPRCMRAGATRRSQSRSASCCKPSRTASGARGAWAPGWTATRTR